jgi:hypothetical protein
LQETGCQLIHLVDDAVNSTFLTCFGRFLSRQIWFDFTWFMSEIHCLSLLLVKVISSTTWLIHPLVRSLVRRSSPINCPQLFLGHVVVSHSSVRHRDSLLCIITRREILTPLFTLSLCCRFVLSLSWMNVLGQVLHAPDLIVVILVVKCVGGFACVAVELVRHSWSSARCQLGCFASEAVLLWEVHPVLVVLSFRSSSAVAL